MLQVTWPRGSEAEIQIQVCRSVGLSHLPLSPSVLEPEALVLRLKAIGMERSGQMRDIWELE